MLSRCATVEWTQLLGTYMSTPSFTVTRDEIFRVCAQAVIRRSSTCYDLATAYKAACAEFVGDERQTAAELVFNSMKVHLCEPLKLCYPSHPRFVCLFVSRGRVAALVLPK
jgi:hypothetical protein